MVYKNELKRKQKADMEANGALFKLAKNRKPSSVEALLSGTYAGDKRVRVSFKRSVLKYKNLHKELLPLLDARALGSVAKIDFACSDSAGAKLFKSYIAPTDNLAIVTGKEDLHNTIGLYSEGSSIFIIDRENEVYLQNLQILANYLHENAHHIDKLLGLFCRKKPYFTLHDKIFSKFIGKLEQTLVNNPLIYNKLNVLAEIFNNPEYPSNNDRITELLPRIMEIFTTGQPLYFGYIFPELYKYVTEHLNPFINLYIYCLGFDDHIDNSTLGRKSIAETLKNYTPEAKSNLINMVLNNVDVEPNRYLMLDKLADLGFDYSYHFISHEHKNFIEFTLRKSLKTNGSLCLGKEPGAAKQPGPNMIVDSFTPVIATAITVRF